MLSDLHLGSESGTAIVRELISRRPDLGVIFMTGSFPETDELAIEIGHDVEVIQKPFEVGKLRSMITNSTGCVSGEGSG